MTQATHRLLAILVLPGFAAVANAAPAADLWTFWDVRDERSAVVVDHTAWQSFLDEYVTTGADGVNRVAYRQAADTDGRQRLGAYLSGLSEIDPRTLNATEQMAYWINLYNALTVEVVMRYPRKSSILRMGRRWFTAGPWDDELITIAGQDVTLNDIEHRILRPIWRDHRIHYAVNCASLGCPNLNKLAYRHDNLETLLAAGEQNYVNHRRGVAFDAATLNLSEIFDWYRDDFAPDENGLLQYLASQHRTLSKELLNHRGRIRYGYDWQLNGLEVR